jgi:tRNA(fMet)-specific endonuclease VapC
MSRYLLDTNILVFILGDEEFLSSETKIIVDDYHSELYTSAINILELIQLYNIGKIKSKKYKSSSEWISAVSNEFYIEILPFTKQHTHTLSKLKIQAGHNDPFDHSIISHAITEKMILVSSDKKFEAYTRQNLLFSFNKR